MPTSAQLTMQAYVDSIELDPTMRTPPSRTMQELTEKVRSDLRDCSDTPQMSPEQLGQLYELLTACVELALAWLSLQHARRLHRREPASRQACRVCVERARVVIVQQ